MKGEKEPFMRIFREPVFQAERVVCAKALRLGYNDETEEKREL